MSKFLFNVVVMILKMISLLPFWMIYVLSDILFFFLFFVFRYRRKVVKTNLLNAFPVKSPNEIATIERLFYRHLADIMLESIKSISITPSELKKRYRYDNLEELTAHLERGRSVILVSGHYGNWEWGAFSLPLYIDQIVLMVYKPLSDTNFDKLVLKMRSRFNTVMVPMKQTLRAVAQYNSIPHVLGLAGDQTPSLPESRYFTTFLNQPTAVFQGIEKIAIKSDYVVGFMSVKPAGRGHYNLQFQTLVENPKLTTENQITDLHTQVLDQLINEKPEFWLWSHRRWKYKPQDVL